MTPKGFSGAGLLALLFCEPALAHSTIEGLGDFYNGLLHPILVPSHLLLLIAVGLFWEQLGLKKIEQPLGAFALATVAGLAASWFSGGAVWALPVLVFTLIVSLLVVLRPALNPGVAASCRMLVALLAGFLVGIDSAQDELAGKSRFLALFGSGIAILFLALYPMALADYFSGKVWQKTGVRIIGSWIAASSLLVLALSLATTP